MWNIVYDIKTYGSNRRLGFQDELGTEDQETEERFSADAKPHIYNIDGKTITVVIEDANKGFDFSGNIAATKKDEIMKLIKLPPESTEDEKKPINMFIDRLIDYTDRNDSLSGEDSLERDDYEQQYGFDLSRNAPLEFAEEVLWIPGIEAALFAQKAYFEGSYDMENFNLKVSDYLRVVPYRGRSFPRNSKPSFFASTDYQILTLAELEQSELEQVIEARKAWYNESVSLQDSIPEIYKKLSRVFSFTESKIYRIRIQVSNDDDSAMVNSEAVIQLDRNLPGYRRDAFSGFRYWRKVNF